MAIRGEVVKVVIGGDVLKSPITKMKNVKSVKTITTYHHLHHLPFVGHMSKIFSMHFICIENVVCTVTAFFPSHVQRLWHQPSPLALC
jgi:hypothetical protein